MKKVTAVIGITHEGKAKTLFLRAGSHVTKEALEVFREAKESGDYSDVGYIKNVRFGKRWRSKSCRNGESRVKLLSFADAVAAELSSELSSEDDLVEDEVVESTPKGDTPKGDTPKGDTPKGDTPKGDTPKGDTPKGK